MTDTNGVSGSSSPNSGSSPSGGSAAKSKNATKISEDFINDYVKNKLPSLSSALTTDQSLQSLNGFATASIGQSAAGINPAGGYTALLAGNTQSARLPSAATLQAQFQKVTSALADQISSLSTNAQTMAMDLAQVGQAMSDGEDKANISASTMSTDLGNLTISAGGTGGAAVTVGGSASTTGGSTTGGASSSGTAGSNKGGSSSTGANNKSA